MWLECRMQDEMTDLDLKQIMMSLGKLRSSQQQGLEHDASNFGLLSVFRIVDHYHRNTVVVKVAATAINMQLLCCVSLIFVVYL